MDSSTDEEQPKGGSPTWLAVAAAVSFALLTVLSIRSFASHFHDPETESDEPDEDVASIASPGSRAEGPKDGSKLPAEDASWMNRLYGQECEAPCSAGPLCERTAENSSDVCGKTGERCQTCMSKMRCIPGGPRKELEASEVWTLRLWKLQFDRKVRPETQPDACEYEKDWWVCLAPTGKAEETCFSQQDACRSNNRSTTSMPISVGDLMQTGVDIKIRSGDRDGPVYLQQERALIDGGMRRRGLCSGFKLKVGETSTHTAWFQFLLEPQTMP